ncbi:SDR family NAD(P)-dependent oxidoreductase [Haliea sp.]|uniref:SDR family NAD(P)-dependent oxidoreductase n=1 Tax=Haliea sp. TaxID=1932666 RepID=UPI0035288EEA
MQNTGIALVTGATSGLGAEYCRQLARQCKTIIAVGRRGDHLQALGAELDGLTRIHPVVADLSTVEGVTRTVEALRQQGPVDLLINNAGFSTLGDFADSTLEVELQMVRLQIDAPLELARAALPFMREQGRGQIINVASVGAFVELQKTAVYGACKAFLLAFSRSLQAEVAGQGIRVQCLCPGLTRTEIHDTPHFSGFDKGRFPESMWMEVDAVVAESLTALAGDEVVVIPGQVNRDIVRGAVQRQLQALQH